MVAARLKRRGLQAAGAADRRDGWSVTVLGCMRGRSYQPRRRARAGSRAAMLPTVIGSRTSWTWPTPAAANARSRSVSVAGSPGPTTSAWVAPLAPDGIRKGHEQGDRALDIGRLATIARHVVDARIARDSRASFRNEANHAFQAATCGSVIASIRSPTDPISGGPQGRGPRGSSSQSSRR